MSCNRQKDFQRVEDFKTGSKRDLMAVSYEVGALEQEEFAAHQTARKKHEQLQAQDEERATLLSKKAAKLQRNGIRAASASEGWATGGPANIIHGKCTTKCWGAEQGIRTHHHWHASDREIEQKRPILTMNEHAFTFQQRQQHTTQTCTARSSV
eukprot:1136688-Pelagomonas_calceolata.AAC.14